MKMASGNDNKPPLGRDSCLQVNFNITCLFADLKSYSQLLPSCKDYT